ncbi:type I polyketide synthase [Streptomyces sp. MNP-20]|uniref:type I polyketide synthase n=1 Tax=Streptomyces sp. MNP-20 TaxID=2721165 RepID=UPI00155749DD|nr:type I polyketide synthase [Streptomyces sp. MNP-20]
MPDTHEPHDEPIAVVGLSCRLPKAAGPQEFWSLLRNGESAVTEVPAGRWSPGPFGAADAAAPRGAEHARWGAFLDGVDGFDAGFFGIAPREAAAMDPQQRLVLELGWEALEDAGLIPATLRGTRTAVFVGAIRDDYALLHDRHSRGTGTSHGVTGVERGIIANRLSYVLGARGPSLTVDTGQSSSLVAVHLACAGLRSGEATLALAGGVHLNLVAESAYAMARLGALSPDGRSHTFDARANGFVRGEGGALVVLKPLSRALEDGDRVHCLIRGSAVNNDGASRTLTTPDADAQQAVLASACRRAGVDPRTVQYVELHGTGTKVGDPVEAAALAAVHGACRTGADAPLLLGSAKTNVGHLEGAAGIVGLVKTALAISEAEIPPSLNFTEPNPEIPFEDGRLDMVRTLIPWPASGGGRHAGVSSFGVGGTNCHVVLASAPPAPPAPGPQGRAVTDGELLPWVVSARSAAGVAAQAGRLTRFLADRDELAPEDVAWSLAATRTEFEHRAVLLGADRGQLAAELRALAEGGIGARTVTGRARAGATAFVFPGQGGQWAGMAQGLWESSPAFRAEMEACGDALAPHTDWSLADVVRGVRGAPGLDRNDVIQPVLFAVMVSLAAVWRSLGVVPEAVVGHSQGEVAAAYVCGALSLDDAARIVAQRGRLVSSLAGTGQVASVPLPADTVREDLAAYGGDLDIAGLNSPTRTVVAGTPSAVDDLVAAYQARGVRARVVPAADYASHTSRVEPVRDELLSLLADVTPRASAVPFYSTVTGERFATEGLDAAYWYRNLASPVLFTRATRALSEAGCTRFIESSAHPVLVLNVEETLDGAGAAIGSLQRDQGGWDRMLSAAAQAYAHGAPVAWAAHCAERGGRRVDLPTYAFQRKRHWLDTSRVTAHAPAAGAPSGEPAADETPTAHGVASLPGLVRATAAAVLGHAHADDIEPDRTFKDLGFDSVTGAELGRRLSAATGLRLPTSLTFDCPTPDDVVDRLRAELGTAAPVDAPADADPGTAGADADDDSDGTPEPDAAEPIAIVSMACRYPGGVTTPEDLWQLLSAGAEGLSDFPDDRGWDLDRIHDPDQGHLGVSATRRGGFLADAAGFDAEFFGISPREAEAMDPQQRLLLETAWEAIERGRMDPRSLRRSAVGVFVGTMAQDYGPRMHEVPRDADGGFTLTGTTSSVASGRIAYLLGLEGPAVTVDTACSSSLVALHLACQSLRAGECSMALAGGATVMASPGIFIEFSRQGGLSPDGRCKAFADTADGTGWGEGVGLVLLERLSVARRRGHRVWAVVRGSAVNQDGASNGLTAPNGPSQQRVIRQALAGAGLGAADVDVVEAHGTGTVLGDPIEAQALLATYGRGRSGGWPLVVGSLKSNVGHTQAAAGVAGVIKMVLAMGHGRVPRTLHVGVPSSHVDWSSGGVVLAVEDQPWPATGRPRRAAVSSFGVGGTNAHLILEQAPAPAEEARATAPAGQAPWVLSAASPTALRAQAERLAAFAAARPELGADAVGRALATGRARLAHRAVVTGRDRAALLEGLEAVRRAEPAPGVVTAEGLPVVERGRVVFVFPGQGSQWAGMGAELADASPVFRARLEECADALAPHTDWSLMDVLRAAPGAPTLDRVDVVQPALFSMLVSLAALWRSAGVEPDAVVGHSQGEIAAACVAGALSLQDAAAVMALRSRMIDRLRDQGGLVSVALPVADVERRIAPWGGRLSVAAVNGPSTAVVVGDEDALRELLAACDRESVRARYVPTSIPTHSARVEPLKDELLAAFSSIVPRRGEVPFFSTVTGDVVDGADLDAGYWYRNLREPVRFEPVTRLLMERGFDSFVEVSPHPVITPSIEDTAAAVATGPVAACGTLRRDQGGRERFLQSAGALFVRGVDVDWATLCGGTTDERPALPTYAFQRERYWRTTGAPAGDVRAHGLSGLAHPLLGAVVEVPDSGGLVLSGRLALRDQPWLADHQVRGQTVVPGACLAEIAIRAGDEAGCPVLDELVIHVPLVVAEATTTHLRVGIGDTVADGTRPLTVHARPQGDDGPWTCHATGTLAPSAASPEKAAQTWATAWPPPGATAIPVSGVYDDLTSRGLHYGPVFRGLEAAWHRDGETFADVGLPEGGRADAETFGMHPALLDAALHALVLGGALPAARAGAPWMPFAWSGVRLHATGALRVRVRVTAATADGTVRVDIADSAGDAVLTADALTLRPLPEGGLARPAARADHLYHQAWVPVPLDPAGPGPDRAVWGEDRHGPATGAPAPGGAPAVVIWQAPGGTGAAGSRAAACAALSTLKRWLGDAAHAEGRLVVTTTAGVRFAPGEEVDAGAAAVWGLVRSAQSENPGRVTLLDVAEGTEVTGELLAALLATGEPQLALRGDQAHAPRLVRTAGAHVLPLPPRAPEAGHGPGPAVRVGMRGAGSAENLEWLPADDALDALPAGHIRVAVRAAGLNFRDVVAGLGMVGGDVGLLGTEAAGVVLDVGAGVTDLAPGDRVCGIGLGSFGTVVVSDRRGWVRMPDAWSYPQAATVPVVFLTAYYGLCDLAGLRRGESLLVHAATGGVGMAAIQLARHLGAEVHATASPPKWRVLHELGIPAERVASSRTLEYEDRFRSAGGGRGVDVVLNSLTADHVDASLRLLADGGRFLEMGKTDIRDEEQVAAVRTGVGYWAYDALDAGMDRVAGILAELMDLFEQGVLKPLPTTLFDLRQAPEAFRFMAQARHTGKVVLTVERPLDPRGTVLVTGGTGDLGAQVARHLVAHYGVRHLTLVSRRGAAAPGAPELRAELAAAGATAELVACDVSDRAALAATLAAIPAEHPLTGVVHCAAALDDGVLEALDADRVERVFAPKADAAYHLHELTLDRDLALFVVFSSAAGVLGGPGQGNYAAANSVLDALIHARRAAGLPGVSLAWGWWGQGSGLTGTLGAADRERFARAGVLAMSPREGLGLFDAALAHHLPVMVPVKLDLPGLARAGAVPPLLKALARPAGTGRRVAGSAGDSSGAEGLRRRLAALTAPEQERSLMDLVSRQVATVLGHAQGTAVEAARPFTEMGFDSLTAVELRNRLSQATGLRMPATLTFDHPTPLALTRHLHQQLTDGPEAAPAAVETPAPAAASDEPIAVVGMSCRFPGGADSPERFWRNLVEGVDTASEVPRDRWDMDAYYHPRKGVPGKSYTRKASFVPDLAEWDAEFFGCTPQEALRLDPQHRLLMETAWLALEDAGLPADRLRGSRTGVFVGLSDSSQYQRRQLAAEGEACYDDPSFFLGLSASAAAGRVAYHLDLRGPCVTVDTACSSALTATHLAVQSLRRGECDLAVVTCASAIIDPQALVQACKMSMLSADGRCKTWDVSADGFVAGEGAGAVVLQRVRDSEREHRTGHAVIRGSAMSQDGQSNGLTAPSRSAQVAVVRAALADAGLRPGDIGFVEAHGSGTSLGDAIEFSALRDVFGDRPETRPLLVGAVKTHVGHLLTSAGMAGLIKSVLAVRAGEVPANLHLERPNPEVTPEGSVRPAQSRQPFPPPAGSTTAPRRAGVSSFGWSGTNIHLVLEQAPDAGRLPDAAAEHGQELLTLSATNSASLRAAATALAEHLEEHPELDLADVAFTTRTGRTAFPVRRALVCRDLTEAVARLRADEGADGRTAPERKHRVGLLLPGAAVPPDGVGELYGSEPAFRAAVDACADLTAARCDTDLRAALGLSHGGGAATAAGARTTGGALIGFTVEYALARLMEAYGLSPSVLVGQGTGHYVAACLAGVCELADALSLAEDTGHAAHVAFREPRVNVVSAATGELLTPDEAVDPAYWAKAAVRDDADGRTDGLGRYASVLVEAGPGGAYRGPDTDGGSEAAVPLLPPPGAGSGRGAWLAALSRLWELGLTVDWSAEGGDRRRLLRLPSYRFQRARYWPTPPAPADATAAGPGARQPGERGTRFLAPTWSRHDALPPAAPPAPATVLVLAGRAGLGEALVDGAEAAGHRAVLVEPGPEYTAREGAVTIDPARPEHYERLLTELATVAGGAGPAARPLWVVHAYSHDHARAAGRDRDPDTALDRGFYSLLWFAQAAGRVLPGRDVELVVGLAGAHDVLGGEAVDPLSAPAVGLSRSLVVEYPRIHCRCVDLDPAERPESAAGQLLRACAPGPGADAVLSAWRRGRRWLPRLEPVRLPEVRDDQVWRPGGVYALTGGTGGLGLALARRLAPTGARIALIGRTELPEPGLWDWWLQAHRPDDRISGVLRAIRQLRAAGAEVLPVTADVADPDQAAAAFRTVREHFGDLHGVVHTAGVPGTGLLQTKARDAAAAVLAPKVAGTLAVADALRTDPPELLVLYSSTVTAVGGHGEGDYGAANAFLDAFATAEDGAGRVAHRVVSVGWGAWQHDRWQSAAYAAAPGLRERARRLREEFGFTDEEGTAALGRVIAAGPAHLYALNQPLDDLVANMRALATPDTSPDGTPDHPEQRYPRPELRVAYTAPRGETERRIALVWQDLLGMEQVGAHDPFFELGGTSMVGLAVVNRLGAEFGVDLAAATLFEHPTVARLAGLLDAARADGGTDGADPTPRQQDTGQQDAARGRRRRSQAAASAIKRRRTGK